jgi:hypothetical protein
MKDVLPLGGLVLSLLLVAARPAAAALLTGTIIGTPGSWDNIGNTITNVFDGNLGTFFDAPDPGNLDWVGLDFGPDAATVLTDIASCPRSTFSGRMVGEFFKERMRPISAMRLLYSPSRPRRPKEC